MSENHTVTHGVASKAVTGLLLAVALVAGLITAPRQASAQDAQLQQLLAQVAQLQMQIAAMLGSSGSSACPYTWARDLTMGSTGADVQKLQQFLNRDARTAVALSGVGSAGQESQYFGPATSAAVAKFQNLYAAEVLTPLGLASGTGYFGSRTRMKANSLCQSTIVPAPGIPTPPPSPTPVPPVPQPSNQESEIDRFTVDEPGNTDLEEGDRQVSLGRMDFTVKDAPTRLSRIDVVLDPQTPSLEKNPWQAFSKLYVVYKGEIVATKDVSEDDAWDKGNYDGDSADEYRTRFSALGLTIQEGRRSVEIWADISSGLDGVDAGGRQKWDVFFPSTGSNGVQFISPNGIITLEGSTKRSQITLGEEGSDAELRISRAKSNPASTILEVERSASSRRQAVLALNLRAEDAPIEVDEMYFLVDIIRGDGAAIASDAAAEAFFNKVVDDVFLVADGNDIDYDPANTVFEAYDVDADGNADVRAEIYFDLEDGRDEIELSADSDETAVIEVRFKSKGNNSANYPDGTEVRVGLMNKDNVSTTLVNENNVDSIVATSGGEDLKASQLTGTAIGDFHTLLEDGIDADPVKMTTDSTKNSDGRTVRVMFTTNVDITAVGESMYIPIGASWVSGMGGVHYTIENPNTNLAIPGIGAGNISAEILSSNAKEYTNSSGDAFFEVNAGETRRFTVQVFVVSDGGAVKGPMRLQLKNVRFTADEDAIPMTSKLLPEQDFQSAAVVLDL